MPERSRTVEVLIVCLILLMFYAGANLYWVSTAERRHTIYWKRGMSAMFSDSLDLRAGQSYRIEGYVYNTGFDVAVVRATLQVFVNSELIETLNITNEAHRQPNMIFAVTEGTAETWLYPDSDCELGIELFMDRGLNWHLSICENLSEGLDMLAIIYRYVGYASIIGMTIVSFWYFFHLYGDILILGTTEFDETSNHQ